MNPTLIEIFAGGSWFQVTALLGVALFFAIVAVKELYHGFMEGYLYLMFSLFFGVAHAMVTVNALTTGMLPGLNEFGVWTWLVSLLAPALCALFCLRALVSFFCLERRDGLIKLFFGLTLVCFLYMLGSQWPVDIRAILAVIWVAFLVKTELAPAN